MVHSCSLFRAAAVAALSAFSSMEIMPPQFRLTCAVNPSNRITAGLAIDGDRFYVTPRNPQLPKACLYSKKPYAAGIEIE